MHSFIYTSVPRLCVYFSIATKWTRTRYDSELNTLRAVNVFCCVNKFLTLTICWTTSTTIKRPLTFTRIYSVFRMMCHSGITIWPERYSFNAFHQWVSLVIMYLLNEVHTSNSKELFHTNINLLFKKTVYRQLGLFCT